MSGRPAPTATPDTAFFWEGVREHRLPIQRCGGCGALRHPARPMCPRCQSLDWDTVDSSGRGRVYSFVMPQHPVYPWFDYPYIVALIELEEGTRLVSNLCDCPPDQARVGMAVEVFFEHFDDGVVLPMFRPAVHPAPDQPAPDQPAPDQPAPDQPAPDQPAPDQP